MILHTVIDQQEVLEQPQEGKFFYKKVDNCILEGVEYNQEVMLNRIISTNLKDYLNPSYQLGNQFK